MSSTIPHEQTKSAEGIKKTIPIDQNLKEIFGDPNNDTSPFALQETVEGFRANQSIEELLEAIEK